MEGFELRDVAVSAVPAANFVIRMPISSFRQAPSYRPSAANKTAQPGPPNIPCKCSGFVRNRRCYPCSHCPVWTHRANAHCSAPPGDWRGSIWEADAETEIAGASPSACTLTRLSGHRIIEIEETKALLALLDRWVSRQNILVAATERPAPNSFLNPGFVDLAEHREELLLQCPACRMSWCRLNMMQAHAGEFRRT